ncbi:MAG: hypothetical protein NVSMB55_17100 [Mycobacteriales bacterium]
MVALASAGSSHAAPTLAAMALQPVGPLPASTYWRRRVLLLVVAVLLLAVTARACSGSAKNDTLATKGAPAARSSPVNDPPASVALTAPAVGSAAPAVASPRTAAPSSAASSAASPPAAVQTCGDDVLQVTTQADADAYPSGGKPRFTLTVRNIGAAPCRRALGPGAVELRVFSGEDRIWSSGDCSTSKEQGVLTLPAGQARATVVLWAGARSKPGCVSGDPAQPGTYRVSARVGDLIRQGSVFRITG